MCIQNNHLLTADYRADSTIRRLIITFSKAIRCLGFRDYHLSSRQFSRRDLPVSTSS
jgi:hypothetical protein